jgi:hypothetical protein
MGEASCRYLMSSVLERDTTLAKARREPEPEPEP